MNVDFDDVKAPERNVIMKNSIMPKHEDAYSEDVNISAGAVYFAFEPDPEYKDATPGEDKGANSYNIRISGDRYNGGDMFFNSIAEIEEFANELLAYVKRHRK